MKISRTQPLKIKGRNKWLALKYNSLQLKLKIKKQMTYAENSGGVERPHKMGEENKMSLWVFLIHMHQAQLCQLAHYIFKMLRL